MDGAPITKTPPAAAPAFRNVLRFIDLLPIGSDDVDLAPSSGELVAQARLENLPVAVFRKLPNEHIAPRFLEGSDLGFAPVIQLFGGAGCAFLEDNKSDDLFPPLGMRRTDYRHLEHLCMGKEGFFDFTRIDVGATRDDDVLRAVGQGKEAVLVHPAEVARSEEHTSELQSRGHLVCRL